MTQDEAREAQNKLIQKVASATDATEDYYKCLLIMQMEIQLQLRACQTLRGAVYVCTEGPWGSKDDCYPEADDEDPWDGSPP